MTLPEQSTKGIIKKHMLSFPTPLKSVIDYEHYKHWKNEGLVAVGCFSTPSWVRASCCRIPAACCLGHERLLWEARGRASAPSYWGFDWRPSGTPQHFPSLLLLERLVCASLSRRACLCTCPRSLSIHWPFAPLHGLFKARLLCRNCVSPSWITVTKGRVLSVVFGCCWASLGRFGGSAEMSSLNVGGLEGGWGAGR